MLKSAFCARLRASRHSRNCPQWSHRCWKCACRRTHFFVAICHSHLFVNFCIRRYCIYRRRLRRGLSVDGALKTSTGRQRNNSCSRMCKTRGRKCRGRSSKRYVLSPAKRLGPRSSQHGGAGSQSRPREAELRQKVDRLRESEAQSTNPLTVMCAVMELLTPISVRRDE